MRYLYFVSLILLFSFFGFLPSTYAATIALPKSTVNVIMVPENPEPNEIVDVSLTSYDTNIDEATITWKVNGKVQKTGKGQKHFQFTSGNMNTVTTLDVNVQTVFGEEIDQSFKIQPVSVDLIWQSESFVPPFYKGKPMFIPQNRITFIALPHITGPGGNEINPKNLVYKWSQNDSVMDDASGYGKSTFSTAGSIFNRPLNITVAVSGQDGVGIAHMVVSPSDPEILFYKKNPLYGLEFQKALEERVELTDSKEVAVAGMPFFFGITNTSSPYISYTWKINGNPISTGGNSNIQVFRQKEGTTGESNISLTVANGSKILQTVSHDFNLKFGDTAPNLPTL